MAAAGKAVQVFLPLVKQYLPEGVFAFHNTEPCHNLRIQEIILKGVIFQDQDVAAADLGKFICILQIPFVIVAAELGGKHLRVLAVTVADHQKLVAQIYLIHVF